MADNQISEVTRRNISDALVVNRVNWSGRFEEQQFLARLYNLTEMPSTDHRYDNAADDIWKHRVMNDDWANDWVFYDSRFNLINAPDEEFLRFLCEMLHPVVQPQAKEVDRIRNILNEHLVKEAGKSVSRCRFLSGLCLQPSDVYGPMSIPQKRPRSSARPWMQSM